LIIPWLEDVHHDILGLRQGWQGSHHLPPAGAVGRAGGEEKRDVRPDLRRPLPQLGRRTGVAAQPVEGVHRGGRIAASATQTSCSRQ